MRVGSWAAWPGRVLFVAAAGVLLVVASLSAPALRPPQPRTHAAIEPVAPASGGEAVAEAVADFAEAVAGAASNVLRDPPGYTRVKAPVLPDGPRRVGIQAGHWLTEQAPPALARLITQTGTSWNGVKEWQINLDIAQRVAKILTAKGLVVDVLPTTIPPGYVADAFVSLHGDGDGVGAKSGFKLAHSPRRSQYENALQKILTEEYAAATGLAYDPGGVTRAMLGYYAHSWTRNKYSTTPHTPSVILEMGFVSNDHDRWLMTARADTVAAGIASGILCFLDEHPRNKLFGEDLLIPPFRFAPVPTASPGR